MHKNRALIRNLVTALLLLSAFASAALAEPYGKGSRRTSTSLSNCPRCKADFAIYDPAPEEEPDGVWEEEVAALLAMFDYFGWSAVRVGPRELNDGLLGTGDAKAFQALIAPGGLAYIRDQQVNDAGDRAIREFIRSGGNFIGFCAGAYWAAERAVFAEHPSGREHEIALERDYASYPYTLKLFDGEARGPLAWMPWRDGSNVNFEIAEINLANPTMKAIGMPGKTRFLYGGGPFFVNFRTPPRALEVWARAVPPPVGDGPLIGAGEPIIIRFKIENGNVILFGYHPDILIKDGRDHMTLAPLSEDQIEWRTGDQTIEEINLHSWNIVHAALRIAANQPVSPLKKLPSS